MVPRMHRVTSRDLRNLLSAVGTLNANLDVSTLPQRALAAVMLVVPGDLVTYNEVDLERREDRIWTAPYDARLAAGTPEVAAFLRHIDQHPLIRHNARLSDPVPRKISDFLSHRQFRSLALHSEFFKLLELHYQMALVTQHGNARLIGIAINRSRSDFTERERTCLAALRLHVMQAYRNGILVARVRDATPTDRSGMSPGAALCANLTPRESEVLHWAANGKSNDAIAVIISASSATVKKHLEHVYEKLGVPNRTAASALYVRLRDGHI